MAAQFYKINYKSDFVLTINSDAGWAVPFCIKFWTGMPSHGYFAGFDGENYVNCRVGDEPTQLLVMFDDHHMPVGPLRMQIAYHTTIEEFPDRKFDEVTNPTNVTVDIDGTEYQVMLDFTGETGAEIDFSMPSSGVMSVNGKIGYVTLNAEDVGAQPTIEDLATIRSGAAAGATAVQPAEMTAALATKQDTISDLATIRNGAAAGATAVQPATLQEGLATKQNVISDLATIRSGAAAGATAVQPAALTPIQTALQTIEAVIPSAATSQNQLADKNFVNSSIATNTANFVGTYNSLAELQAVQNPTNNDYGFVIETDAQGNEYYDRYKYVAASQQWLFEYKVESTPFTAAQWAAIQSGITSALVTKLNALPTNAELQQTLDGKANTSDIPTALSQLSQDSTHRTVTDAEKSTWNGKQDTISDLATIRSGAAAGATAYQKPGTGIPSTDFTSAVQTSLERADEAAVRPYNTQSPDGMGYLVLDKEATFASQVTTANTIYEIRYDYDLNGQTVTIPANCVLKFNGGKLVNGTINGQLTSIDAEPVKIFSDNLNFTGTWNVPTIYTEWFGAAGNGTTDDTSAIQRSFDFASSAKKCKVTLLPKNYIISTPVLAYNVDVMGIYDRSGNSSATIKAADEFVSRTIDGELYNSMLIFNNNVNVENIFFNGQMICSCIHIIRPTRSIISNCLFYRYIIAVIMYGAENTVFHHNYFNYGGIAVRASGRQFKYDEQIYSPQSTTITSAVNCVTFYDDQIIQNNIGIYIEQSSNLSCNNVLFAHNSIFAIKGITVKQFNFTSSYSEGDGCCIKNIVEEGTWDTTIVNKNTSQNLINNNLDGADVGGTRYHGIFYFSGSGTLNIIGSMLSYKKRGKSDNGDESNYGDFDFTRTKSGVDTILIAVDCKDIIIKSCSTYNWNLQKKPTKTYNNYDDLVLYGCISGTTDKYILPSIDIDEKYKTPILIVPQVIYNTTRNIKVKFGQNIGISLNKELRLDTNCYSKGLQGSPHLYDEVRGVLFTDCDVALVDVVDGIPLYHFTAFGSSQSSSSGVINMCVRYDDIRENPLIEVCRFIKPLHIGAEVLSYPQVMITPFNYTGNPQTAYRYNPLDIAEARQYLSHGLWLQRIVLNRLEMIPQLCNVIISAFGSGNLQNTQDYLFSPFFVRELGNESIPDFSSYEFIRKKGTTANRPIAGITTISGAALPQNGKQIFQGYCFLNTTDNIYYVASNIASDGTITWVDESTIKSGIPSTILRSGRYNQLPTPEDVYNYLYDGFNFQIASDKIILYATNITRTGSGTEEDPYVYKNDWAKRYYNNSVLTAQDDGYSYYDTTLKKAIYATAISADGVVTWKDNSGNVV